MRWKQYLTPVQSIDTLQGAKLIEKTPSTELLVLDVRQPKEYRHSHIPGAKLIPLPELRGRLHELNPDIPILVY